MVSDLEIAMILRGDPVRHGREWALIHDTDVLALALVDALWPELHPPAEYED